MLDGHLRRGEVAAKPGGREARSEFDYTRVSTSVVPFLQGESDRIRRQYRNSIVQLGHALLGAKRYLSHGSFVVWVEAEVGMPSRTAQAYMRVAQWAADKSASVACLSPTVLYLLAASNTPSEFAEMIIRRAETGEVIAATGLRRELAAYLDRQAGASAAK